MLQCDAGQTFLNISKDTGAFVFKGQAVWEECLTLEDEGTISLWMLGSTYPSDILETKNPQWHHFENLKICTLHFHLQEAATSTQSVSSDGSSSNDEKMMITIQTDGDQPDLAISDTLETSVSN